MENSEETEKKSIYKNWWFGVILIIICILIFIAISFYIKNRQTEEKLKRIGEEATDFISSIDNAQSHLNEFSYNYQTGEVEYEPSRITLETYNRIKEGMLEDEVISILGKYENKLNRENTYMLEWGNSYAPITDGHWIQIVFDMNKKVSSKHQMGLK